MKYTYIPLLILCYLPQSIANPLEEKIGFSGEISFVAGISVTSSNLSTEQESQLGQLNTKGNKVTQVIAGPLGSLQYRFGENGQQKLFVGTERDDLAIGILALEVGYEYRFASDTKLSFSYLPSMIHKKVWRDPYIVDANKIETEQSGQAFRFKIQNISGIPLTLDVAYAERELDEEWSGTFLSLNPFEQSQLNRNAEIYYSKVSYRQFLGRGKGVIPSISYIMNDASGEAMQYEGYGFGLSYFVFSELNNIIVTLSYEQDQYQVAHPIFHSIRKDDQFGVFVAYERANFFDVNDLSFVMFAGYDVNDSNIDFYHNVQSIFSTGVSYRF